MSNFYVYIYLDPRKPGNYKYGKYEFEYEPFYVGKGSGNRLKSYNNRNNFFIKIVNKIENCEQSPIIIKLKDNLTEKQSFILESELINIIGRNDLNNGSLVNFTDGGEGVSGYKHSEKTKRQMSEFHIGLHSGENNPMFGKKRPDTSERMSGSGNYFYGKHHSEEWKKKQSERNKGKNNPMYGIHLCGEKNGMFGKHQSEELRKKTSERMKLCFGENALNSILTEKDVIEIRIDLKEGILTQKQIAKKFGVKQPAISKIKLRKTWSNIKI